ncbi:MAG TPA: hypothetical protein ENN69_00155, partial [Spirochaetia bacterium]|nr:hypothetical protein [Spirochaetia bacterium]
MSDINIPGVTNDRIDTQKMIKAIMDAERVPLTRMEGELDAFKESKRIWQDLNRSLTKLDDSAKELFSFNSPFYAKKALSSNESVLTATANRKAVVAETDLIVKRIATADRFMSGSVPKDFQVKAGTYRFTIGDKEVSFTFHGGSLTEFAEQLNKKGGKYLRATVVNNTADTQVIVIESLLTGDKNKLTFHDAAVGLAEETGMMKKTTGATREVPLSTSDIQKTDRPLSPDRYSVESGILTVTPQTSLKVPIAPPFPLNKNMVLTYEVKTAQLSEEEVSRPETPPGPTIPETGSIEYKGIRIYSEKSIVILPEEGEPEPPKRIDDLNVMSFTSNGKQHSLPPLKDFEDYTTV